jgi:hypothetical protein
MTLLMGELMARITDELLIRAILYFEGTAPAPVVNFVYLITKWLDIYDPEDEEETVILADSPRSGSLLLNHPLSQERLQQNFANINPYTSPRARK